ncbi:prostatic acid phosphatase-like isoform X2 [Branchiostoma lanceolatum]|uniref:prostatic acid phosphatase-like isoform X2 n=1 Tax=Branchiostoma lanceolatum TaxID=7740 RepID=UPI00345230BB
MVGMLAPLVAVLVLGGFVVAAGQSVKDGRSLVQASVLFRHGDRSPTETFPNDVHQEDAWPQGFGFLSEIGIQQHHNLGEFFRKRYGKEGFGVLSEEFRRDELYVRSTDTDRTLMSAEANLDRLYPDQPIPIHTVRTGLDPLLRAFFLNCPRWTELMEEDFNSDDFKQKEKDNKEFMAFVVKKAGWGEPHGIMDAWRTQDPLLCEKAHGMSWPAWVTADVYKRLTELTAYGSEINFRGDEKGRLMAGLLVNQIVSNMTTAQGEIQKNEKPYRLLVYSAHDIDISALLSALDVYNVNDLSPPYAACVMVELYRDPRGQFSVQILYRNDSSHEPYVLTIPGCDEFCPFDDFVELNDEVILSPGKWRRACELPPITWLSGFLYGVFAASIVLLAVLYLMSHLRQPASSGDKKSQ